MMSNNANMNEYIKKFNIILNIKHYFGAFVIDLKLSDCCIIINKSKERDTFHSLDLL